MCIILVKKGGIELPKKAILKNCFENNPDGAGFMYTKDNKVIIDKGYMDFTSFYKRIEKLKKEINVKDTPIILHFRIGTSGLFTDSCTHPFALTDKDAELLALNDYCKIGVAHNGVIPTYADNGALNDTQNFIKRFLYPIYKICNDFLENSAIIDIIENVAYSKFAFLTDKSKIYLIGSFVEDNGIFYSNESYKKAKKYYKKVKNTDYTKYYDEEAEDDNYIYNDFDSKYLDFLYGACKED